MSIDTLWYTRCPVPTPLGIAFQQGWLQDAFRPDGITVRSLQDTADPALRESHFDHTLAHSFRQGGNIPAIWARARGATTRVIGLSWTDEFQGIVTLPGSGIADITGLRGRRLGLPKHAISIDFTRAAALKGYESALALEAIGLHEVELVDLRDPPPDEQGDQPLYPSPFGGGRRHGYLNEVQALLRGEVDAVFVKGVLGLQTVHMLGAHVVTDLGRHPDPLVRNGNGTPRTLTVDQALIDARPDLIARFLGQVVAAGEWALAHPHDAVAYIGRETDASDEWVRYAYGRNVHTQLQTDLAATSIAGLKTFKDFLLRHGFLTADVDIDAWIDPAPLAALSERTRRIFA
ncbi:desulfurase [Jeongeupia sp. HS-3]|uniref:ABC transporter substrate-binding protein n=1 Tax=Jeongeupia sp. HS-3 TaxID=1009682 RepID=UPI0018A40437|nr:ABC transporter substrate-binding protein [Jeongeupia sp. HS-3]BCL74616.1 desulfurase [Jeongeupia sp. HS-3]